MNRRFGLLLPVLIIAGVAALAWCFGGFFQESNICTHCGAIRNVRRVFWIPLSETRQTPLSLYQRSIEGTAPQQHQWMFTGGHGGPIHCALGRGRNLIMPVQSHEMVDALKNIRKHRGDAAAKQWIDRILDPKTATDAYLALYGLSNPTDDFDSNYATATEDFGQSQVHPVD